MISKTVVLVALLGLFVGVPLMEEGPVGEAEACVVYRYQCPDGTIGVHYGICGPAGPYACVGANLAFLP